MKKLALAALLAITPVTFAETLEHVEEEVHLAMETSPHSIGCWTVWHPPSSVASS